MCVHMSSEKISWSSILIYIFITNMYACMYLCMYLYVSASLHFTLVKFTDYSFRKS